jgi:hypothetical protein
MQNHNITKFLGDPEIGQLLKDKKYYDAGLRAISLGNVLKDQELRDFGAKLYRKSN